MSQAPRTELSDPQHTFRDVLFATPPGHEDSQCLKLTSFDKLLKVFLLGKTSCTVLDWHCGVLVCYKVVGASV